MLEKKKPLELEEDELENIYGGVGMPALFRELQLEKGSWECQNCKIIVAPELDFCPYCRCKK